MTEFQSHWSLNKKKIKKLKMNCQVKNFVIKMEVIACGWIPPELNPKFIAVYRQYGPVRAVSRVDIGLKSNFWELVFFRAN